MPGPLAGVRVVDLTAIISGPMATQIMGDQGADVIKVEPLGIGDMMRYLGAQRNGVGALFSVTNRSKRSVALDLKNDEGKALLTELVKSADVFVQNFRPGAIGRMGFGYEDVKKLNPDVIFVSISGFGQDGPYAGQRVYDAIIQATAGFADTQTDPETGKPTLYKTLVCDKVTALTVSQAITSALFARANGQGGQHLKINMLDASIAFLWPDAMYNHTFLEDFERTSDFSDFYKIGVTKDGFVSSSALSDAEFQSLCRALDRPDLAEDPKMATMQARIQNADLMQSTFEDAMAQMTTDYLVKRMHEEDVPGARVNKREEIVKDPQVINNGIVVETTHPVAGKMQEPRPAPDFGATPAEIRRPSPTLGQHTEEVLIELGLPADRIGKLREANVIN